MSGVTSINLVENALLVSIQDDVTDTEIVALQETLSNRIAKERVKGVILDISSLEIVDTFVGRVIAQLAGISRLLAAETYVVGMRPAVAVTLVELGMYLPDIRTALSLTHALSQLRRA
ncbi:STAS domain-containing protein [Salipiger thiooxidans]|uniref:STAS domain-containing protein n=1 Tax=Salipiger thiooxidans TaxID=282683 RepID=UPI001A8BFA21|nr:STAS domain-containing protein [Salipiger thiooxidans]MBN8190326.1 STAS domain-containing protein [Salipiger thiooxidans]MBR9841490.1 STAS domain-containing protein [Paracoccaceae bacterium]MCA0851484.1 STAS domain-containing protein [Salipiger thiooxidans]